MEKTSRCGGDHIDGIRACTAAIHMPNANYGGEQTCQKHINMNEVWRLHGRMEFRREIPFGIPLKTFVFYFHFHRRPFKTTCIRICHPTASADDIILHDTVGWGDAGMRFTRIFCWKRYFSQFLIWLDFTSATRPTRAVKWISSTHVNYGHSTNYATAMRDKMEMTQIVWLIQRQEATISTPNVNINGNSCESFANKRVNDMQIKLTKMNEMRRQVATANTYIPTGWWCCGEIKSTVGLPEPREHGTKFELLNYLTRYELHHNMWMRTFVGTVAAAAANEIVTDCLWDEVFVHPLALNDSFGDDFFFNIIICLRRWLFFAFCLFWRSDEW